MRLLVYTCVFGGYDRIFPPVARDPRVDYVVVTDRPTPAIRGWETRHADPGEIGNPRLANRYFKILGHQVFSDYDASIYVDGNIRLLYSPRELLERFCRKDVALGLFRHPQRSSVADEVTECVRRKQVRDASTAIAELQNYRAEGFDDSLGLMEAGVILRNHRHPELDRAMRDWWRLFEKYQSRDQFSLPFVLWKNNVPHTIFEESFRLPNPYFGWYPHIKSGTSSEAYAAVAAKAYGSRLFGFVHWLWNLKWTLQRRIRKHRHATGEGGGRSS